MLVFFKFPRGSTIIENKRVYGFLEQYQPVKISHAAYKANLASLVQAPYDKPTLERLFPGREFPAISFTYSEIRYLSWEQLCALCKAFGITTNREKSLRRRALRKFFKENC